RPASVDNVYFPQIEVVGDIASSVERLAAATGKCDAHDFTYYHRVREHLRKHLREGSEDPGFPIKPQRLVWDVRRVLPDDGVIALDNGVYKIWFARNYPAKRANTVLLDNALATMGAGLPSAMEVARLHPDRRVMAICGDGGFMMNSQELETAMRLGLDLVVLILRDDAYGMIRWKQYAMGLPDYGLQYGNPDFPKYAEAYGAHGHRVESAEALVPLLERCFEERGLHVVEVPVDYSENQRVLVDELRQKVCLV
ncbi:MAG: acetolactate synthase large subunit, partial [Candidatus Eisenbacteria bacterium]|nr:acetolactate synthase large subunit [Candidatus Eisenbacteria bacterium]